MSRDPELEWVRAVHRAGAPQLTLRALLSGIALGGLLCLSNLYVVLKTGWSLGVTLTSCILAFALFRTLAALGVVRRTFSALENNAMGSMASAAAFMTGGGNMAALPALLLLTGARPGGFMMFLWFAATAALGVFAAIPLKRQLINVEALPFPSAVATAEALRSLHGGREGLGRAKLLAGAGLAAGLFAFLRDARLSWLPVRLPGELPLPFSIGGHAATSYSLGFANSLVLLGGGTFMAVRTALSMALGAVVAYVFMAPALVAGGLVTTVEYKTLVTFTLWPGAALLVSSGLLQFALDGRRVLRSLGDVVGALRRRKHSAEEDEVAAVEAPSYWFPLAVAVLGPVLVVLMAVLFGIPWWAGVLAIPLALFMAVIAARVTGETDITPTKALGPATQLVFGVLVPGNVTANVMSANVTGGVGLHAADLLTDLKSGYLLGASPRQQIAAQLVGVLVGAAVVVPAFDLLVPDASALGTTELPAPAAMVWAGVSQALSQGLGGLAPELHLAIALGLGAGVVLTLAERYLPPRFRRFVPSPTGCGIGMIMPAASSFTMCTGALLALGVRRRWPRFAAHGMVPLASGVIAGESLVGVGIAIARATGVGI